MTGPKLPRTRRSVLISPVEGVVLPTGPVKTKSTETLDKRPVNNGFNKPRSSSKASKLSEPDGLSVESSLIANVCDNVNNRGSRGNGLDSVDCDPNFVLAHPQVSEKFGKGRNEQDLSTVVLRKKKTEMPEPSYSDGEDEVDMACSRPIFSADATQSCSCSSLASKSQDKSAVSSHRSMKSLGSPMSEDSEADDIDHMPVELPLSVLDLFGNLIGIGSYISDVVTDCWVSYTHFVNSDWWWFGLTLGFIIGPSLVMTSFSTMWYVQEHKGPADNNADTDSHQLVEEREPNKKKVSTKRWVSRFIFLFFQIAPVLRYLDSIIFCCRSWRAEKRGEPHMKRHWYELMLYEDTDATLLRLMECFMEAAPQLVLQLYIISIDGLHDEWYHATAQVLACVTSLFSLSWAIAAYHKALRLSLSDKGNTSWTGFTLLILWRVFTIGARISAMALFASKVSPWIFAAAVALHWLVMFIWCLTKSTSFCHHPWQEPFFKAVMSVVYIFGFLNLLEGHTRFRYLFYYTVIYTENVGMMMVWYWMGGTNMRWFHLGAMVVIVLGFFVGIFFQAVYYKFFHPNNFPPWSDHRPIRCCLSWAEICATDEQLSSEPAASQPPPLALSPSSGQPVNGDSSIVTRGTLLSHHKPSLV